MFLSPYKEVEGTYVDDKLSSAIGDINKYREASRCDYAGINIRRLKQGCIGRLLQGRSNLGIGAGDARQR